MTTLTYTTPGITTWVVPADCRKIDACWAVGSGANGSAGTSSSGFTGGTGGNGGGAGGAAYKAPIAVTAGETLSLYVGSPNTFNYSGIYRPSTNTWLILAYGGQGQTGGQPGWGMVGDNLYAGGNGASGSGSGGTGLGGAGGAGGSAAGPWPGTGGYGGAGGPALGTAGSVGGPGNPYGGGGGGGGGGTSSFVASYPGGAGGAGYQGILQFTYTPYIPKPPTVTGLSSHQGRPGGGETITVSGTNFDNTVSNVLFGAVSAVFTVTDATTISVTTPQHTPGTFDVRVVNVDGTSPANSNDLFTFKTKGGINFPMLGW